MPLGTRNGLTATDGDLTYGVFITDAGERAIGVSEVEQGGTVASVPAAATVVEPKVTKSASVLALLRRDDGATLAELTAATGWLPHTTRAALTGIRKKGHAVEKIKRGDATCYRISAVAA